MSRTTELSGGSGTVLELEYGQTLRVTSAAGGQRAHVVCINRGDQRERFSAPNTMLLNKSVYFGEGSTLFSYWCEPMMTLVGSRPDAHDTVPGPVVDGRREDDAAHAEMTRVLGGIGLAPHQSPFPLQLFTHHRIDADGTVGAAESTAEPDDAVLLRAELDLVVALVHAGAAGDAPLGVVVESASPESEERP